MCFSWIHWSEPSLSIEPPGSVRKMRPPPREDPSKIESNRSSLLIPQLGKPGLGYFEPRDLRKQPAWRNHLIAAAGEFAGTFMFLFFAFLGHSTAVYQASSTGANGLHTTETIVYISLSYGFSLLVNAWIMYRVSGGLFNPAVTLGLVLGGGLSALRGLIFFPVQLLAAISSAAVVKAIIPGDIRKVQTTLGPHVNVTQGLFLEMFLTALLVLTVLMLAAEKSRATFLAPIGIGIALFVAELAGVVYTGASLNPVRSFAPCVVAPNFQHYHWIYWVGPFLGAVLSGSYYHFVKFFNYQEANPGQDSGGGSWTPPESPVMYMGFSPGSKAVAEPLQAPAIESQARSNQTPSRRRPTSQGDRGQGVTRRDHYHRSQYRSINAERGRRYSEGPRTDEGRLLHDVQMDARRFERGRLYDEGFVGGRPG